MVRCGKITETLKQVRRTQTEPICDVTVFFDGGLPFCKKLHSARVDANNETNALTAHLVFGANNRKLNYFQMS